ncbi:Abi family protein [Maritalea mediterranea]|uniref:Abi family protein n=1 Tax=Maritalea mediterranea TaxID=2909667 RepID=A0ABS9EAK6_9HYPH|nr:Abi family protein [Maritalea mediterranea]MCF4099919.1 Abi family protein [Maritalea mediterranea]
MGHKGVNIPATPLDEAQQAGFLLPKIPFQKQSLDIGAQRTLLEQRGMDVEDPARAEHYLRFIGYYRLSGYWFPFQYRDGGENHDDFRPGLTFETVLDRYVFDRRLRVLIMDASERIEVAARTAISNALSERVDPHWYLDSTQFVPAFDHNDFMRRVRKETGIDPFNRNKQSDFIRHYLQKYDNPQEPPSWMVFELLPFGTVSIIFKHLIDTDKKLIANEFGLPRHRLQSWLHACSHLRNLCAHHSRVWNREFGVVPSVARSERHHVVHYKRFYNHAVAIQTLLKRISGDTHWADRLQALLEDHPNIPIDLMGFPPNWRNNQIWL